MNKIIESVYFDPKSGYTGVNALYKRVKAKNKKITMEKIKQWLAKQTTYTLHKPALRNYSRNRVLVSAIDEQWQADLCDMQSIAKYNDGFKYILTCIDLFSKFAWAEPLKTKHGSEIIAALNRIFNQSGRVPNKLQTDAGTEFVNKEVQKMLKSRNVTFFTTKSEVKASVVERFNRTLKERMWRYFTKNNTYKYIDILEDLIKNYNNSYHRTIKTYPANVDKTNETEILQKVFRVPEKHTHFKFDVGDKVRLNKVKKRFEKGYIPNWTEEYFIITEKHPRIPPVYNLKDQMGEKLDGIFYEPELQKIDSSTNDLFIIEKILKTRKNGNKTDYLVRWRGYPPKFDSWVSDLVKV